MRYQKGFIAVFREDYNDHFEGGCDLFGLFIYLTMNAHRHKDKATTYTKGRQVYSVGFGEFYTTYNYLARWTGTSYRTLKVRLDLLEHRKYISLKQFDNCMCVAIHVDIMQRMVNTDDNTMSLRMSPLMDKGTRGQGDKETRDNISRPSGGKAADDQPPLRSEKALKGIKKAKKPKSESIPPKKLFDLWNELSGPLKGNQTYTPTRAKACKARLTEKPDLEYWRAVIVRIRNTPFCLGHNNRNWRADIDFLLRVNTHVKVMEGKYEKKAPIGHESPVQLAKKDYDRENEDFITNQLDGDISNMF